MANNSEGKMEIGLGKIFNLSSLKLPQFQPSKKEELQSGSEIFSSSAENPYKDHVDLGGDKARTSGNITLEGPYYHAAFSSNVSDDTQKLLAQMTQTMFNYTA